MFAARSSHRLVHWEQSTSIWTDFQTLTNFIGVYLMSLSSFRLIKYMSIVIEKLLDAVSFWNGWWRYIISSLHSIKIPLSPVQKIAKSHFGQEFTKTNINGRVVRVLHPSSHTLIHKSHLSKLEKQARVGKCILDNLKIIVGFTVRKINSKKMKGEFLWTDAKM